MATFPDPALARHQETVNAAALQGIAKLRRLLLVRERTDLDTVKDPQPAEIGFFDQRFTPGQQ